MPSPLDDDYYALLGVHAGADSKELRRAWRKLALQWHPDRAGEHATATFQKLSTAYAVLSDPLARAAYNRRRRAAEPARASAPRSAAATSTPRSPGASGAPRSAAATSAAPPPPPSRPPTPAVMLSRLCGPLATLIGCGVAQRDEPGFITLLLRDDEAAQGGMATISMPVDLWCPDCAGQEVSAECERCGGTRKVRELFSAWLAVPPGVTESEVLAPSVELPGMVAPVRFRVRIHATRGRERG
jgi:molecular chaperone DnaJ